MPVSESDLDATRAPIIEHLKELRDRLIKSAIALLVGMFLAFFLAKPFLEILISPLQGTTQLQLLKPTENIITYFKASLILGGILAAPFIVYQIVAFIVPGLTERERRGLYMIMPLAGVLFAAGVAFSSLVVLPFTLRYLQTFLTDLFKAEYSVGYYMSFVANFVLWVGIAFETPLIIALLARFGVVTPAQLRSTWRYAIVLIAVLAAVITPTPDPFTMSVVMVPLLALYVLGIVMASFTYRSRQVPGSGTPSPKEDTGTGSDA
ncbi:MAG: twin-arginine translocase subunit TatC [Caldilineae bacterium]|nr:MAG: twin-arginine translocase subunit TatC [Caldilineae bacterium]